MIAFTATKETEWSPGFHNAVIGAAAAKARFVRDAVIRWTAMLHSYLNDRFVETAARRRSTLRTAALGRPWRRDLD
ncbi:hypothetical protein RB2150_08538 [Rhodobacterales bacterium HTCC2150]|nr:hypothetical protein RB2150_08538 [Rhodobacterales bacterium HTCC2150] [Rhodobacteraceae bacterium HTCC2150]